MTIRQIMQAYRSHGFYQEVCEYAPLKKRPARLDDEFHGHAEIVVGKVSKDFAFRDRRLKVCRHCKAEAERYVSRAMVAFALSSGRRR